MHQICLPACPSFDYQPSQAKPLLRFYRQVPKFCHSHQSRRVQLLECSSDSCGTGPAEHLSRVPVLSSGTQQKAKVFGGILLSSLAVLLSKCVVDSDFFRLLDLVCKLSL